MIKRYLNVGDVIQALQDGIDSKEWNLETPVCIPEVENNTYLVKAVKIDLRKAGKEEYPNVYRRIFDESETEFKFVSKKDNKVVTKVVCISEHEE